MFARAQEEINFCNRGYDGNLRSAVFLQVEVHNVRSLTECRAAVSMEWIFCHCIVACVGVYLHLLEVLFTRN